MSDIVVSVENLSKRYRLGVIGTGTLRDDLKVWFARQRGKPNPLSRLDDHSQGEARAGEIWALSDINFDVRQGESLGIIGRNGAGKSTLLKILSRVTTPTSGRVRIKGRIASLLEVGTGFHPELTGRENVYLNGAIMGMRKTEVARKFDEIVDFSGIEKFIDTPVKRYSSGMYVRLAFAVAAHLDPEILIIDEVLAVGDAEFQKKCLGKMGEVTGEGRTILFVSHNMGAVEQLCTSGLLLNNGLLEFYSNSSSKNVINKYLNSESSKDQSIWINTKKEYYSANFFLREMYLADKNGNAFSDKINNDEDFYIFIEFDVSKLDRALEVGIHLYDEKGNIIFISQHTDSIETEWPKIIKGANKCRVKIPCHFLNEGKYFVKPTVSLYRRKWLLQPSKHDINIYFNISGGLSKSPYWYFRREGFLAPILEWENLLLEEVTNFNN